MDIRIHIALLLIAVAPSLAQNWQDRQSQCGLQYTGVNTMIVGGNKTDEYEWPWQAAMYRDGRRICGASLIDQQWIITAAHCVSIIFEPEIFEFRVGSVRLSNGTVGVVQKLRASEVYVHPDYNPTTTDNDIALFKMEETFNLWTDYKVNTVCLPTKDMEDEFAVGEDAVVTGWGALVEGGGTPDELYEVTVPIYDQIECNEAYNGAITDNMICAGVAEGGIDSCQGDSGGPMVAFGDDNMEQYYLIGIVSWGEGCAREGFPGVYTRVTEFEDWIAPIFNGGTTTKKNGTCAADEFLCRGGECIPEVYRCSGAVECYHGTDEEFCDGLLKMFDVFYYDRIAEASITRNDTNQPSKEHCANTCLEIDGCRAFDVTPLGDGTFTCAFAMEGFTTVEENNDANRTFNHFVIQTQVPFSEFKQAAGVIASPSYFTDPEAGNQWYTWNVNVPFSNVDTTRFTVLDVNGSSTCEDVDDDFALLSITGGDGVEMTSICLNEDSMGTEFTVIGSEALVEMLTSNAMEYSFLLDYQTYFDCNMMYTIGPGVVLSPNYPSFYPNSVKCTTHLQAPEGEIVFFTFDEIDIETQSKCGYDWVALYDGASQDEPLVGKYCGETVSRTRFQSSGRDMFIVFSSDGSVNGTGFKANFDFDIYREPTKDPNIAYINSLESELSSYKFGMAACCVLGALLIMVIAASLYTVNKRDANNMDKLAQLEGIENGKPAYNRMIDEDDDNDDHIKARYVNMTDEVDGPSIASGSQGSQASKDAIVAETGYNPDYETIKRGAESGGVVNQAFAADDDEAASAAAVAAVEEAVVETNDGAPNSPDYQSRIVVSADVTPLPKGNDEEMLPPPPPQAAEAAAVAADDHDAIPPPPPAESGVAMPSAPSENDNHIAQYIADNSNL